MRTLNLGILAHVDAGKTSLTERLLHAAGVIDEVGSVDDGSTQTDTLALERQRGITIKSAVVSFVVGDVRINLIDTPGHPDFIAEVERVLSVLDGAVLVISAVEGVQAQTRVLMRALQRLRVPTVVFVNKIDRRGADTDRVARAITERLTPFVVAMGTTRDAGARDAAFRAHCAGDASFSAELTAVLAEHDDALLAAFVDDEDTLSHRRLRRALARQTRQALVHPLFFGSAITGAGVPELTRGITELLPALAGDGDGPASGTVFKIERGAAGERIAYVRLFTGAVRTREKVRVRDDERKVTAIEVFERGATVKRPALAAGEIGKVWGLGDVEIGDALGEPRREAAHHFAPPTLETVIVPCADTNRGALRVALEQLAEQDPLINLRQDDVRHELYLSLYGEVQKEVIQETLSADFGVSVEFRETTPICIERPVGSGEAIESHRRRNPFLATVGLRVEPAPVGSGITFRLEVELGSMPAAFFTATEDAVHDTLRQGLRGWQVTDCVVTMTHAGYSPRQSAMHATFDKNMSSTGWDFRTMTPLVLMRALQRAGTTVCEPIHRFQLEAPADVLGPLLPALARLHAVPAAPFVDGSVCRIDGHVPAARVHELQQLLPGLTRGEAVLECEFDSYQPVRGEPPARSRTDNNPVDREEYLLRIMRRV